MIKAKLGPLIKKNIRMFIAMSFIMAMGIMIFIMAFFSYLTFETNIEQYREKYNFADITIIAEPFLPSKELDEVIAGLEGVQSADLKMIMDYSAVTPQGRLVTLRLHCQSEQSLEDNFCLLNETVRDEERFNIALDYFFADRNDIKVGETITLRTHNGDIEAYVYGIMTTPENFSIARNQHSTYDYSDFGYVYAEHEEAIEKIEMTQMCNQIMLHLAPAAVEGEGSEAAYEGSEAAYEGSATTYDDIVATLGESVDIIQSYDLEGSPHEKIVNLSITPLKVSGIFVPIFISLIAAVVSSLFMLQIIQEQRREIGIFRALGYLVKEITRLYAVFSLIISIIAIIIGSTLGTLVAKVLSDMYIDAFAMPTMTFITIPWMYILVSGIIIVLGQISTVAGAFKIAKIDPADSLRSDNVMTEPIKIPTFGIKSELLLVQIRFAVRQYKRTMLTIVSIAVTAIIILAAITYPVAIDDVIYRTFAQMHKYDAQICFTGSLSASEIDDIMADNEHISSYESAAFMTASITYAGKMQDVQITALCEDTNMLELRDEDENLVHLQQSGIILEYHIAEMLGATKGDVVSVNGYDIVVADISFQNVQYMQYISLTELEKMTDQACTSIALVNMRDIDDEIGLSNSIKEHPRFDYILFESIMRVSVYQVARQFYGGVLIIVFVAAFIAFLIVYTISVINVNEKKRDISILLVQGISKKSIILSNLVELVIEFIFSMCIAVAAGIPFSKWILYLMETDRLSYGMSIGINSLITMILSVFIFMLIANLIANLRMHKIDLVESLKNNE